MFRMKTEYKSPSAGATLSATGITDGVNTMPAVPNSSDSSVVPVSNASEQHFPRGVRLSGVANCRDFGGLPIANSNRVIKEKMLFRMAAPTYATEEDKCLLLDKIDIITLIDLRTSYETKNLNFGRRKFEDNFIGFSVRRENGSDIDSIDPTKEVLAMQNEADFTGLKRLVRGTPRVGTRRHSSCGVARKRYNIPLINNTYFYTGVYPTAPASTKLKCNVVRTLFQSDKVATYFMLRHLNDLGLFEMYRLTVEHTKREILTILRIMKNIDNFPIGFFCSLGKDRTGMITALVLSCLGVSRDLILEDYHQTEIHLEPSMPEISAYFQKIGLTNEEFVLAPKKIMQDLLEYLDRQYGSIPKYLDSIGFTFAEQKEFFDFMTVESKLAPLAE